MFTNLPFRHPFDSPDLSSAVPRRSHSVYVTSYRAILFVSLLFILLPTFTQAQDQNKRVLVIHHYGQDVPVRAGIDLGFQNYMRSGVPQPIEVYTETLESYRFTGEAHSQLERDYLRQKYAGRRIDAIVAVFDPALSFVLKYRNDLFPGVPIVFIANREPLKSELQSGLTGILSPARSAKTLDLALSLHPKTESVLVIDTIPDNSGVLEREVRDYFQKRGAGITLNYLRDYPFEEVISKVKALPERSVILFIRHFQDGEPVNQVEALKQVSQVAKVPTYGITDGLVGLGIVGGDVFSSEDNGAELARIAVRVVNGTNPSDIPLQQAVGVPMFDWRQLRRWSIAESQLPPGSIIRYKQLTFWEQYKGRIIASIVFCLLQFSFIGYLLLEQSRRRKASERLLVSQAQLKQTFQVNPQPMSLTTRNEGRYIDVNDSFLRMSGYARDEVIGHNSTELRIWDKPETRQDILKGLEERGYLRNIETRFRKKDGSFRVLLSSVESITIDGEACLMFASSDITERKVAEDRFRRFFDLPLVGMAVTSPSRRFLLVNHKLCQLLGYSAEELTQMSWVDVTHPEDVAANVRLLEETLRGETEGYVMDKRFIHRDGSVVYVSLSAQCVRNEDGKVDQLVLIVQDITERKQAEEWLSELTARLLRYQDEERRRIARELHDGTAQGIGVILLNLARVKRAATMLDSVSKDRLTESIALGEEALKEIRTLSYVLHPPLLDQAGLPTALHWYVKGFTERSGVKVDFVENGNDGPRMPPDVEYSLFRVVQECLTNIRRHTNSESASISLTRTSEDVILEVRDYGSPFKMETPRNGDGIESLGVGIPGMRHRLKQLGGDLAVNSAPGGTTVTATVPVKWVIYDSHLVS